MNLLQLVKNKNSVSFRIGSLFPVPGMLSQAHDVSCWNHRTKKKEKKQTNNGNRIVTLHVTSFESCFERRKTGKRGDEEGRDSNLSH